MFLSEMSVKRPVTTMMFFSAVVLLGVISVVRLPLQMLPDLSPPAGGLRVYTYADWSGEEFEREIIEPFEGMVARTSECERMSQVYSDGENFAFFTLRVRIWNQYQIPNR